MNNNTDKPSSSTIDNIAATQNYHHNYEQEEQHEWIGIDNNLWLYVILDFVKPLDLFFGLSKCCRLSRRLCEDYIKRKIINLFLQQDDTTKKMMNIMYSDSDLCYLILMKHHYDLNCFEGTPPIITTVSYLELAAEKEGFYEFCFQQYVLNTLKKYEKEWTQKGLLQLVFSKYNSNNNYLPEAKVEECCDDTDLLLFEEMMKEFTHYKSFLKRKNVKEEIILERMKQLSLRKEVLENWNPNANLVKCCIIGCGGVGKTTFCKSLDASKFEPREKYLPTIACSVSVFNLSTPFIPSENLNITLWDTAAGDSLFRPRDIFYCDSKYCIIAFDLTSYSTLKDCTHYIGDVRRVAPYCKILIVGMKSDYNSEQKISNHNLYNQLAMMGIPYIEISSKLLEHNTVPLWFFFVLEHLGL